MDHLIRQYAKSDKESILQLLQASLREAPAGTWNEEFFDWKHANNPFGHSFMLVCEVDGQIVGLRAFMRWGLRARDGVFRAVRAVDTATHPDHQGRGIFSKLTTEALRHLRDDVELVFNTPNDKSLPGYLKMGWANVGTVKIFVRMRRPFRSIKGMRGRNEPLFLPDPNEEAVPAVQALQDESLAALLAEAYELDERLQTRKTIEFLRWRYGAIPALRYWVVCEGSVGVVDGLGIFHIRQRRGSVEGTVADLIVRSGDIKTARRLLRKIANSAPVDYLTCHFPRGSTPARAATMSGFVPTPKGITFVTNPLREMTPSPMNPRSWALTLGDIEIF